MARALVAHYGLLVVEDLKVRNMVRRPAPRPDPNQPGRFLPNRAAAKTGLHRSIHDAGWAQFVSILRAKAEEAGRVVIDVDARHTSDRCEACGHTARENRASQAVFSCRGCGHTAQRRRTRGTQHPPGWTGPSRRHPGCVRRSWQQQPSAKSPVGPHGPDAAGVLAQADLGQRAGRRPGDDLAGGRVEHPVVAGALQLAVLLAPEHGAGQVGADGRLADQPAVGEADGQGPVVVAGVAEGDRLAGREPVGDLGRGGGAAAVAPEQPDRHPGGPGRPARPRP